MDLINQFSKDLSEQIKKKYLPNYFNHQINLLNPDENYTQWLDYINDRTYSSLSLIPISNRPILIDFLFQFTNQFYQKQSEFYLNDTILLDLHRQISEKFSNKDLILNKQILENIQKNFISNFESNAELVHSCLNQIRKSQSSLIFHYTWTIFIQYLHTYLNVLWNTDNFLEE